MIDGVLDDSAWQDTPLEARDRIAYLGPERQDRYERYGLDARVADVVTSPLPMSSANAAATTGRKMSGESPMRIHTGSSAIPAENSL